MADLGDLKQYLDPYDVTFSWGQKKYRIKPTAEQVLRYKRDFTEMVQSGRRIDSGRIYQLLAPLFGSKFDPEEWVFSPADDEDVPHRGLINELLDKGADFEVIDRLLSATQAKYQYGNEVAEMFAATGDMGKALQLLNPMKSDQPKTETQQTAGETNEDD